MKNHGDRKSPKDRVVGPTPSEKGHEDGLFMRVALTTY